MQSRLAERSQVSRVLQRLVTLAAGFVMAEWGARWLGCPLWCCYKFKMWHCDKYKRQTRWVDIFPAFTLLLHLAMWLQDEYPWYHIYVIVTSTVYLECNHMVVFSSRQVIFQVWRWKFAESNRCWCSRLPWYLPLHTKNSILNLSFTSDQFLSIQAQIL